MERHATCSAGHWAKCFCWSLDGGLVSALPSPTCNYFLQSACVETTRPAGHAAHCYCWSLDGGPTGETLRRVHSMDCQFFSAFSAEMKVVWCCFCIVFCLHHKLPRGLFRFQALGHESSETQ